jgi:hypothetical protein
MQTIPKTRRLFLVVGLLAGATLLSATVGLGRGQPAPLPDRVTNSPELSAVVFSGAQRAFVQIQLDRGTITAIDRAARTITILQRQAEHVWRSQSFTIPTGAEVFLAGQARPFRRLRIGLHVRIEQTAVFGAALAVVRVDARADRDEAFPGTTNTASSLAGGTNNTAAGGSAATGVEQHPHLLPARFSDAPELAGVVFSGANNSAGNANNSASSGFIELQFDRGKITAVSGGTITILQRQGGHVWRTQTFTIPASANIALEGNAGELAKLKVGMHVRIAQSGPIGGSLTVVRVDSQRANRDINLPNLGG